MVVTYQRSKQDLSRKRSAWRDFKKLLGQKTKNWGHKKCWDPKNIYKKFWVKKIWVPDIIQTPSRDNPDTLQTPFRQPSDIFQTFRGQPPNPPETIKTPPDTLKTCFRQPS